MSAERKPFIKVDGNNIVKLAKQGIEGIGNGAQWAGKKTEDAFHSSARWLYERGRMVEHTIPWINLTIPGHSSWRPQFYFEEEKSGVPVQDRGTISVAIPLQIRDGKKNTHYPAIRSPKLLTDGSPNFPIVLIRLEDPHKDLVGEEKISVILLNAANGNKVEENITWRMWVPGEDITIYSKGEAVQIPNIEATAADLIEHLVTSVDRSTNHKVSIQAHHVYEAFSMIASRSDVLAKRWELLTARLEFQRNLLEFPEYLSLLTHAMIGSHQEEFKTFVQQMRDGKIKSWKGFLDAADQLPTDLQITPGATLPLLLTSGVQTHPNPDIVQQLSQIPKGLILGIKGIHFFNAMLVGYRTEIIPLTVDIANKQIGVQKASLEYHKALLQQKIDAWKRAKSGLGKQRNTLMNAIDEEIASRIDDLQEELRSMLRGPYQNPPKPNTPLPTSNG
jgi:hypothetical protein